jgi:ribosomal protein S25
MKKRKANKVTATSKHSVITPTYLARLMGITIDKAKEMLRVTTQKGIRTAVHPISRRYRVNHLDLHSTRLAGQSYVDLVPVCRCK